MVLDYGHYDHARMEDANLDRPLYPSFIQKKKKNGLIHPFTFNHPIPFNLLIE